MFRTARSAVVVLTLFVTPAAAQDPAAPAGSLTDVTGVWTMLVEGHQIGLELEQSGSRLEGVMLAMGRRILLVGDYVERRLTLRGERPEDGVGHIPEGESGKESPGPLVATMQDDGTFVGELSTTRGRSSWTGERLKPR